ncbi:phosphoglucosamine mutase [Alkaliphilus sp. B6464]|uniref:phosphoglucosamine mutase n=1 Tax=Alkaliphilus sp. B6464 TaxID=2731219 RepID=UPI001BA6D0FC|nr:phosphoglucosamine mutase [Alkaliphilus sp. B6464]QUH18896.1 phosphoglucosamine mutase [Alkaliphilus sp. B6464]
MGKLFGTDGVRGIANRDLTPELAYRLGRIGAYILSKDNNKRAKVVIGKDTRVSGDLLESAMTAGFLSMGVDVISLGVIPTPAVAYLTRYLEADFGVVISASHNPSEYNGIKFFNSQGYKLPDAVEDEIEEYILNDRDVNVKIEGKDVGIIIYDDNSIDEYTDFLKTTLSCDFKGLKVAVDAGNGAAYKSAPKLLKDLGAEIIVINDNPDGTNINKGCGSTNPEVIAQLVKETGANIGISFDGDADRLIAVDENAEIVDGDHIMAICGANLKKHNRLKKDTIVGTVMSNIGLEIAMKEYGCSVIKSQVGDRYVLEEMIKGGYSLGGEQSGHVIFLDHNTTGDGLLTAIQLIATMKEEGKKLSELASIMTSYPQVLINAKVKKENKGAYKEDPVIMKEITAIEEKMAGQGRVLIRPSGTEPLVRVMLEGKNQEELNTLATNLAKLIEERLD